MEDHIEEVYKTGHALKCQPSIPFLLLFSHLQQRRLENVVQQKNEEKGFGEHLASLQQVKSPSS